MKIWKHIKLLTTSLLLLAFIPGFAYAEKPKITTTNTITLAAVGDISCNTAQRLKYPCVDRKVSKAIERLNPDHVLLLGDIQYQSASVKEISENFARNWAPLLDRSMAIPGNHEYRTPGAKGFFNFFTSVPERGYYTVKLNDMWSILAINTNDKCEIVRCDEGSKQYRWIERQLQELRCVIAISHHPRFSTGEHGSNIFMKDIYRLLRKYKVPVLLSGHDHHYERFTTKVAQYVVGTGGKDLREASGAMNSIEIDDNFGFLEIKLNAENLKTMFQGLTLSEMDSHEILCES